MDGGGLNTKEILTVLSVAGVVASLAAAWGDLDVNTVSGRALVDGAPCSGGTVVIVRDLTTGNSVETLVDGRNIPPFLIGQGLYDTGDVPGFNTGDQVSVSIKGFAGAALGWLNSGTTIIDISVRSARPPGISPLPDQWGVEDVPWSIDLGGYVSDPDTPLEALVIQVNSPHVAVSGMTLNFLYPEGVTQDLVEIQVSDRESSTFASLRVKIQPVNDPPALVDLQEIRVTQGQNLTLPLWTHLVDPDNGPHEMIWELEVGPEIAAEIVNGTLSIPAPVNWSGLVVARLTVRDPGGLSTQANISIRVEPDYAVLAQLLGARVSDLERALDQSVAALQAALILNEHLERIIGNISDQALRIEAQLREAETQLTIMDRRLNSMLIEAEVFRAETGEKLRSLGQEKEEAQERAGDLEVQILALEQECASLRDELGAMTESHRLKAERLSGLLAEANRTIRLVEERARGLECQIHNLSSDKGLLARALDELEGEKASVEMRVEEMTGLLQAMENRYAEALRAGVELKSALSASAEERESLKRRLGDAADRLEVLRQVVRAQAVERPSEERQRESMLVAGLVGVGALAGIGFLSLGSCSSRRR